MIGIDVEFFAQNQQGWAIPAMEIFSVTPTFAGYPRKEVVKNYGAGPFTSYEYEIDQAGKITEDGLAVELVVNPNENANVVFGNLINLMRITQQMLQSRDAQLTAIPKIDFAKRYLTRPELRVLGCSPDQSIYTGKIESPAIDPKSFNWRTSGGHFHFSCGVTSMEEIQRFILLADLSLGLADVLLDHTALAQRRRDLYGQPGKFRVQPHGIEYRSCSSVWTTSSMTRECFKGIISFLHNGWRMVDVQQLIKDFNVPALLELIQYPYTHYKAQNAQLYGVLEYLELSEIANDLSYEAGELYYTIRRL